MSTHDQYAEDVLLYALGSLDEGERQRMEAHLRECAECRRELLSAQEDLGLLAMTTLGPKPPGRSRERLLAAMAKEPRRVERAAAVGKGWIWIPWFTTVACALLAALLYFVNLKTKNDLAAVRQIAADKDVQLQQTREMLELLKSPDAVRVTLTMGNEKPKPQAKTIYSPKMGRLIFIANNLPPTPEHMAYELWLVPMKGAPMPCGTFWPDSKGNVAMTHSGMPEGMDAKMFAVTLEKEEGAEKPTMPMVMQGEAGD